jgi:hypothetical protein
MYLYQARPRLLFIHLEDKVTRVKCKYLLPPRPILMFIYLEDE